MTVDANVLDKIAGLLQLAEKNNSVHESAAAASAAQALLTKYRLTKADLSEHSTEKKEAVGVAHKPLFEGNRQVAWRMDLAVAVTTTNGCRLYLGTHREDYNPHTNRSKNVVAVKLVGRESDIQIVRYFYEYLSREIERLCQAGVEAGELRGKTACNSFKMGAKSAVTARLYEGHRASREEAQKALTAGTSTAIVKLDNADAEVAEYYNGLRLGKGKARQSVRLDAGAYNAGKQAGARIALNKGLGGRAAPKALAG